MRDDDAIQDDEIDINLRPAPDVGARLLLLASLCRRLVLERDDDEAEAELFDLRHWLSDQGLANHATHAERRMLDTRPGDLSENDIDDLGWSCESFMTLAWATEFLPTLPPYDELAAPAPVLAHLPLPWDPIDPFVKQLALRPEVEIAAERERAELWLWRAATEVDRRAGPADDQAERAAILAEAASEADGNGLIAAIAGDLALGVQPFGFLEQDHQELIGVIAERRLHALNWCCGFGATWSDVPLDV